MQICCVKRLLISGQITPGQHSSMGRGLLGESREEKRKKKGDKKAGGGSWGLCLLFGL